MTYVCDIPGIYQHLACVRKAGLGGQTWFYYFKLISYGQWNSSNEAVLLAKSKLKKGWHCNLIKTDRFRRNHENQNESILVKNVIFLESLFVFFTKRTPLNYYMYMLVSGKEPKETNLNLRKWKSANESILVKRSILKKMLKL